MLFERLSYEMKKIIIKLLIIHFFFVTLNGCKSISKFTKSSDEDVICLAVPELQNDGFYATGSAKTLEQAKLNARQDLVLQISSNVSAKIENKTTDTDGRVDKRSSSWTKSESETIPISKHKVIDSCKVEKTYYAAITLKKQALIESTTLALAKKTDASKKLLASMNKASLYQKYIARQKIEKNLSAIKTYTHLLNQYAHRSVDKTTKRLVSKLEKFITASSKLVIGVRSDKRLLPLQDELEHSLNKAELDYKRGGNNTVAVISLQADQTNQMHKNQHIVKLNASLNVSRGDNGNALSKYNLGQVVKTSTVSYQLAFKRAQHELLLRLKQHLKGGANKVRKILGLTSNE